MTSTTLQYKRILLKLSGEALCGSVGGFGIDSNTLRSICVELAEVHALGCELGLVIGGGNIFRGLKASGRAWTGLPPTTWAMLATVLNAMAVQDALEKLSVPTRVMRPCRSTMLPAHSAPAVRHLEKGRVVSSRGHGNPYFSTIRRGSARDGDPAAVLCKRPR